MNTGAKNLPNYSRLNPEQIDHLIKNHKEHELRRALMKQRSKSINIDTIYMDELNARRFASIAKDLKIKVPVIRLNTSTLSSPNYRNYDADMVRSNYTEIFRCLSECDCKIVDFGVSPTYQSKLFEMLVYNANLLKGFRINIRYIHEKRKPHMAEYDAQVLADLVSKHNINLRIEELTVGKEVANLDALIPIINKIGVKILSLTDSILLSTDTLTNLVNTAKITQLRIEPNKNYSQLDLKALSLTAVNHVTVFSPYGYTDVRACYEHLEYLINALKETNVTRVSIRTPLESNVLTRQICNKIAQAIKDSKLVSFKSEIPFNMTDVVLMSKNKTLRHLSFSNKNLNGKGTTLVSGLKDNNNLIDLQFNEAKSKLELKGEISKKISKNREAFIEWQKLAYDVLRGSNVSIKVSKKGKYIFHKNIFARILSFMPQFKNPIYDLRINRYVSPIEFIKKLILRHRITSGFCKTINNMKAWKCRSIIVDRQHRIIIEPADELQARVLVSLFDNNTYTGLRLSLLTGDRTDTLGIDFDPSDQIAKKDLDNIKSELVKFHYVRIKDDLLSKVGKFNEPYTKEELERLRNALNILEKNYIYIVANSQINEQNLRLALKAHKAKRLQSITLVGLEITDETFEIITRMISGNSSKIDNLQLLSCKISTNQIRMLAKALENSKVNNLNLEQTVVGDEGFEIIVKSYAKSKTRNLNMTCTGITDQALKKVNDNNQVVRLKYLDVSHNMLDEDAGIELAKLLPRLECELLNLEHNELGSNSAKLILENFAKTDINILNLGSNNIRHHGIPTDATSKKRQVSISLSNNPIGDQGVENLIGYLTGVNVNLLELVSCNLSNHSLELFNTKFESKLKDLNICNNVFNSSANKHLQQFIFKVCLEKFESNILQHYYIDVMRINERFRKCIKALGQLDLHDEGRYNLIKINLIKIKEQHPFFNHVLQQLMADLGVNNAYSKRLCLELLHDEKFDEAIQSNQSAPIINANRNVSPNSHSTQANQNTTIPKMKHK